MRYTPYTEAQIQSMHVMDEGVYTFEVLDVITTDKNNNPLCDKNGIEMAKLKLMVWDRQDRERIIYTFVAGDGTFAYKFRHFAKTLGMIEDYEQGTFNIHKTVGKSGHADIVIKKGTMKSDGSGEMWPDRNDVKDFVIPLYTADPKNPNINHPEAEPLKVQQSDLLDDDVPF